ncbi:hypothetical protein, partial [Sandarakinorhabdus oryzae]|uniref:hypothetical protein n=1 Tax=Sandarakinorhabdus oryzae TaxID=2675220 RepID=UPI001A9C4BAB
PPPPPPPPPAPAAAPMPLMAAATPTVAAAAPVKAPGLFWPLTAALVTFGGIAALIVLGSN